MAGEELVGLKDHLAAFEARIVNAVEPTMRRVVLLELARAIDIIGVTKQRHEDPAMWREYYCHAWPKALSLFLDETTKEPGAPLFYSTPELHMSATATLRACMSASYCELVLGLARYGLLALNRVEDGRRYVFRYATERAGMEADEVSDQHWISNFTLKGDAPAYDFLEQHRRPAIEEMKKSVYRWMDHYIGYDADPISDEYFEAAGLLASRLCSGQDTFPGEARFGGQPFNLFRASVGVLVGWGLKHQAFCSALLEKHPDLVLRNILTITAPLDELEASLAAQLDTTEAEARLALEMMTVGPHNKSVLHESGPAPMLVTVGERRVIRSIAASTTEPFFFMLRELRRRFPSDWDREVDSREKALRDELYTAFGVFDLFAMREPIDIRDRSRVLTDIDAGLVDLKNGVLALFQLKWQDPFGYSMRERESRKNNFIQTANKWVAVVDDWCNSRSLGDVCVAMRLPAAAASAVKKVQLFVISRNHAQYSGPVGLDPRAAYGNWNQVIRILNEEPIHNISTNPLAFLWDALRARTENGPTPRKVRTQTFALGNVAISIEPP